ncbi:MAG TPA: pitrilysin family protein [Bacteroidales bacterium]|nr:pitrilysin family protein [Bacteroidales bacterium]
MNKIAKLTGVAFTLIMFLFIQGCTTSPRQDKLNIAYEKFTMPNGLQVVLHQDHSDPVISYAIMYHVGSSREIPGKTGFAHLFEHLLFGGSENVPSGSFDKILENAGGNNNGFTERDITTYFEVFPKNALDKVLWIESDRMGFFINSVTKHAMAIQQNVVQNEKRQSVDNAPYGFTSYLIYKNLYPQGHPYSWDVIGDMDDLKNASLDDVKNFYSKFYGPNNATLVLSGDFNPDSVKPLLTKYFGEIKSHGDVPVRTPMVASLSKTVKLYHEDNFASVPEINLVWPAPQAYQKDAYALDFLANLLASGEKAPLYKVLVKEKKLTSRTSAYNSSAELAGEFTISIRANEGKSLKDIEAAVMEGFDRFEKDGITQNDIERIKATSEKNFYMNINSVLGKSIQLAFYNTYLNNPGFIEKDLENIKSVTIDDVKRVYETYIKNKPHVVTSFVPKGQLDKIAEGSENAGIKEENINQASKVEIEAKGDDKYVKSPSAIDRTKEPGSGPEPILKAPEVWRAKLSNGIEVAGIVNRELPLVSINLVINGGINQDRLDLPGVATMTTSLLQKGTKSKTPEQLEEAIQLLGSALYTYASNEETEITGYTLSRNFGKTVSLMSEILLEPRWDTTEFTLAKTRTRNQIIQSKAQPRNVAYNSFLKLLYGKDNVHGISALGTIESVDKITLNDLKDFYSNNYSPNVTRINIVGNVTKEEALQALKQLEEEWKPKDVKLNTYPVPPSPEKATIYFVDIPGSRQSVIYIGYLSLTRDNPDFVKANFVNYKLGGSFTSILNQILREEKGYTYGASSYFWELKSPAPFIASSMVRSDATFESMKIFKEEMEKYGKGVSPETIQFIKNAMIRSNALKFETNDDLLNMLSTMTKFGLPDDYVLREENVINGMTVEEHKSITGKYIIPGRMIYLVVGDAATQMKPLEKLGFGKPVLLKNE